jgi:hypothetical protein
MRPFLPYQYDLLTDANGNDPTMRPGGLLVVSRHGPHRRHGVPTLHEPLNCNGKSGVQVVITPASGKAITLSTNAAGNFYSKTAVAMPFTAKVVVGGVEKRMMTAQSTGNCNLCHTQDGASQDGGMRAPGRIIIP